MSLRPLIAVVILLPITHVAAAKDEPPGIRLEIGTKAYRSSGTIYDVGFTKEGVLVGVSADHEASIVVWDRESGLPLKRIPLPGHGYCMATHPTERELVVGSLSGDIWIVGLETGKVQWHTQLSESRGVHCLLFATDGSYIAAGTGDGSIVLWDRGRKQRIIRNAHKNAVLSLGFSPDTKLLVAGGIDKTASVWDIRSLKKQKDIELSGAAQSVDFGLDSLTILAACPGEVVVAKLDRPRQVVVEKVDSSSGAISIDRPRKRLFVGQSQGTICILSLPTLALTKKIRLQCEASIRTLSVSRDGARVAALNKGRAASVCDANTGKEFSPPGHTAPIEFAKVANDHIISVGGSTLRFWNKTTGAEAGRICWGNEVIMGGALSGDRKLVAIGGTKVHLVDLQKRIETLEIKVTDGLIGAVAFGPNNAILVGGGSTGGIHIWGLGDGREIQRIDAKDDKVSALAVRPSDGLIVSVGSGKKIHAWRNRDRGYEYVRGFDVGPYMAHDLAISPAGKHVAVATSEGVVIWDIDTGRCVHRLEVKPHGALCLSYSRDGKSLSAARDCLVIWELATMSRVATVKASCLITSVCLDRRSTVLTGGSDTCILAWELSKLLKERDRAKSVAGYYRDLGNADAVVGQNAISGLVSQDKKTLEFLELHLRPELGISDSKVRDLILQLDSEEFRVRDKASKALESFGERVLPQLKVRLKEVKQPEVQRRVRHLLASAETSSNSLKAIRSTAVLEELASPRALALLRRLSKGFPESRLTREAKASLQRLRGQTK